jgi:hypothetical protein
VARYVNNAVASLGDACVILSPDKIFPEEGYLDGFAPLLSQICQMQQEHQRHSPGTSSSSPPSSSQPSTSQPTTSSGTSISTPGRSKRTLFTKKAGTRMTLLEMETLANSLQVDFEPKQGEEIQDNLDRISVSVIIFTVHLL